MIWHRIAIFGHFKRASKK